MSRRLVYSFFFFNDTATTEIYTLSLHDALPILMRCGLKATGSLRASSAGMSVCTRRTAWLLVIMVSMQGESWSRSEEHTSELQSRQYLVCRLLLEKKKTNTLKYISSR